MFRHQNLGISVWRWASPWNDDQVLTDKGKAETFPNLLCWHLQLRRERGQPCKNRKLIWRHLLFWLQNLLWIRLRELISLVKRVSKNVFLHCLVNFTDYPLKREGKKNNIFFFNPNFQVIYYFESSSIYSQAGCPLAAQDGRTVNWTISEWWHLFCSWSTTCNSLLS